MTDMYEQVMNRAARALDIDCKKPDAYIVINQGRVANIATADDDIWTLGGYLYESGGHMKRAKLRLGIYVPEESDVSN